MKKKEPKGGAATLRNTERSLCWVTFSVDEKKDIRIAAGIADQPMSKFVRLAAIAQAEKILKDFRHAT